MKNTQLIASDYILTKDVNKEYAVKKGSVLIFAVPLKQGIPQRRTFIAQMEEGEKFPAMYLSDERAGEWTFLCTAMDKGELLEQEIDSQTTIEKFCERIQMKLFDIDEFHQQIVERVALKLVTEEGHIFAVSEEQKNTYYKGLRMLINSFRSGKDKFYVEQSGNALYDTMAYLMCLEKISIVSFDLLKNVCARKFGISDITRLSQCIHRKVILETDWQKKQAGNFIVFTKEGNKPYVAVQKTSKSYVLVDVKSNKKIPLTKEVEETLNPQAYMIYRPFENKELSAKDVISFCLENIKRSDVWFIFLLALLSTGIGLLLPIFNEKIFDTYIPSGNQNSLIQVGALMIAFAIGNLMFVIVKNLASYRIGSNMGISLQSAMIQRIYNMPVSIYGKYESADLAKRVMDIATITELVSNILISTLLAGIFSVLYLFRMFKYSSELAGISIVLIIAEMIFIGILGFMQIKYEKQIIELQARASSTMYQLLSGISKIRIAGVENRALNQFLEYYIKSKELNEKSQQLANLTQNVNIWLGTCFSAIFYYMVIVKDLEITLGEFTGFTSGFGSFSGAMLGMVIAFLQVNNAIPIYERAKVIFRTTDERRTDCTVLSTLTGKIDINNVSFKYDPEGELILENLSIAINPGEYVAIVGSSGSGKSTLLKLLLGFEEATKGKIYYDNQDIDHLDKRELRKKMGVVLQDGKLLEGSIYENVTITSGVISIEKVQKILSQVGIKDEVDKMPMGIHTVVSEGGSNISGGQCQRLLIARAIINAPKVIYFDEATSALDNVNQALISESIDKIRATKIIIAHRLSTIINCDRILVLNQGRLVEDGNYEELMAKKGYFYDLAIRQVE
ncbi:MAG: NHLP bacteriocin export ABC transporter permease/ATPase subunit [Eubacteriales bacterium]